MGRTKEYHLPFHNYAGPGTNVFDNVMNGKMPYSNVDLTSLYHDVDYLKSAGKSGVNADLKAMKNTNNGMMKAAMGLAALTNQYLGAINHPIPNLTNMETNDIGDFMEDYLDHDVDYLANKAQLLNEKFLSEKAFGFKEPVGHNEEVVDTWFIPKTNTNLKTNEEGKYWENPGKGGEV